MHRHIRSPVGIYPLEKCRFAHMYIDIVSPHTPSCECTYYFMCVDRYARWVEVFSMKNQTAETVIGTFYSGWVAKYDGVAELASTDQERQCEEIFSTSSLACLAFK